MDLNLYRPLLDAALNNKWEAIENFSDSHLEVPITTCGRTALHIAAGAGHSKFVLQLLERIPIATLERKDSYDGNTALHLAVIAGLEEVVKAMVQKHENLKRILNEKGLNPLLNASIHVSVQHAEIIKFLCDEMKDEPSFLQGHSGAQLICNITRADLYELAYNLTREYPSLATACEGDGSTMLDILAEKGSKIPYHSDLSYVIYRDVVDICKYKRLFSQWLLKVMFQITRNEDALPDEPSVFLKWLFKRFPTFEAFHREDLNFSIFLPKLLDTIFDQISSMTREDMSHFLLSTNILKVAAKNGSTDILKKCLSIYPEQLWLPQVGRDIFQIAVENRRDSIFDYLYDHMSADEKILTARIVGSDGGNILHVAAKIALPARLNIFTSPVAQMQSEIKWFKKVEKRVPRSLRKMKNGDGNTPEEVFTREHKDLVKKAEAYMIRTAESCLVVAALVNTVAFAAAYTVPGGNFGDNDPTTMGKPIFLGKKSFVVFMVVDALALLASTTTILVFLFILAGSFAEAKFEALLPRLLVTGLVSLILSVVYVMIAFNIAFSIILGSRYAWAPFVMGAVTIYSIFMASSLFFLLGELVGIHRLPVWLRKYVQSG